jgi:uncharacterized protein (DUF2252 family)
MIPGSDFDPSTNSSEEQALEIQAKLLGKMSPTQKLELTSSYSRAILGLADADVRSMHPDWSDRRIRIEASRRWLTTELHQAAFGSEIASWNH